MHDEGFTEELLDAHYWSACPMLTKCSGCKLTVEIPNLHSHMLNECDVSKNIRSCKLCREPMDTTKPSSHVCLGPIPGNAARCPLCRALIALPKRSFDMSMEDHEDAITMAWKEHVIGNDKVGGCKANPRVAQRGRTLRQSPLKSPGGGEDPFTSSAKARGPLPPSSPTKLPMAGSRMTSSGRLPVLTH